MEWTYRISAAARPRVLMRIAQLFDQQLVPIRVCLLEERGGLLDIVITIDVEPELAQRIHAKLYHHVDLLSVDLIAGRLSTALTDEESRRPVEVEAHAMDAGEL
jgi:hypothetical protein